ncbi:hypothetical protein ACM39_17265 [Chryseobacterium sp. FH2]|uniref:hypothetical protein n=1 Tax=Chryseobacterium sp. FH2 TaxID=1674291 RepID=UPI00065AE846|nr:hypothetical protein [Chryseobacterium sp. FH2]KMQ62869.1 hypothetical protein ACM39_17265 [Chryseobacterium sp. FH2]
MKNFIRLMSLLFILTINFTSAQEASRKIKVACYTTSCCSFLGFFDVDLISTTHCHYITTNKDGSQQQSYSSTFTSNIPIKDGTVKLDENVIMPQFKDEEGTALVLPKGEYIIKNNEVEYNLSKIKHNAVCWSEHVTGTILGHNVDYTVSVCVFYPTIGKLTNQKVSVSLKFDLDESQREEIRKNNNMITFKENTVIKKGDIVYTIKAGDYFVNDNDEIYIINSSVK